jgi:phospholipid/cholesterol/gamma-HCH transport system substrate-binding protein
MKNKHIIELTVGLFIIAGFLALFMLSLKVSGLSEYSKSDAYTVYALFDNIGDLKVRAPVTIAGVHVGEVTKINLDPKTFRAKVEMLIDKRQNQLPKDTAAQILTAGLIGANYIELSPGFDTENLSNNSEITETHPAIILENLISQFIYQSKKDEGKDKKNK